jgi:hypothetical protein
VRLVYEVSCVRRVVRVPTVRVAADGSCKSGAKQGFFKVAAEDVRIGIP